MSKTDKTRPFIVKMAESPCNYKEVHNHAWRYVRDSNGDIVHDVVENKFSANGSPWTKARQCIFTECDLPLHPSNDQHHDQCRYTYSSSFINSGEAYCGCPICADQDGRKVKARKERYEGKKEARDYDTEE